MKIIHHFDTLPTDNRPVFCAIGMFDGVHLGHQSVLNHVIAQAKRYDGISVALTFKDHPADLLTPDRSPTLIYPSSFKQTLFESQGVDLAWIVPFDRKLSQLSAEEFVEKIRLYCANLSCICVGSNFSFGHQRKGNVELLKQCGERDGFNAEGKPAYSYEAEPVSSTRIRDLIKSGNIDLASKLIGRPYQLLGQVVRGDGVGRQLGFPTANLDSQRLALPPLGVYAITCDVNGERRPGVLNIGKRPTLNQPKPMLQIEAHFWGIEVDLYGNNLALEIKGKIRNESRFPNLDALKNQIHKDIETAKGMLSSE
jgi:riboflavin kinase / FMN adenylyltransferase